MHTVSAGSESKKIHCFHDKPLSRARFLLPSRACTSFTPDEQGYAYSGRTALGMSNQRTRLRNVATLKAMKCWLIQLTGIISAFYQDQAKNDFQFFFFTCDTHGNSISVNGSNLRISINPFAT